MKSVPVLWRHSDHDVIIIVMTSLNVQICVYTSCYYFWQYKSFLLYISTKYTYSKRYLIYNEQWNTLYMYQYDKCNWQSIMLSIEGRYWKFKPLLIPCDPAMASSHGTIYWMLTESLLVFLCSVIILSRLLSNVNTLQSLH